MLVIKCIFGAVLGAVVGTIGGIIVGALAAIPISIIVSIIWNAKIGDAVTLSAMALLIFIGMSVGLFQGLSIPLGEGIKRARAAKAEEEARRVEEEARRKQYQNEQQGYRNQMTALSEQSILIFRSLPGQIGRVEKHLDQADAEFADSAFAPFWDCIESATRQLANFDEDVSRIKNNLDTYRSLTQTYNGTPPGFALERKAVAGLSMANAAVDRMLVIVRKAQRNFQFAMIYEQRKTNQILVAGFRDLAHALNDMSWQLASSITNLAQSVDRTTSMLDETLRGASEHLSDIAETAQRHADQASVAAEEASDRENETLKVLENIQRSRRLFS